MVRDAEKEERPMGLPLFFCPGMLRLAGVDDLWRGIEQKGEGEARDVVSVAEASVIEA